MIESIKDVSRQLADSAMKFYSGNQPGGTPGLLPGDSNWWEAGALFGQVSKIPTMLEHLALTIFEMVEYWYLSLSSSTQRSVTNRTRYYTGDTTYNDITKQALLYQVGPNNAFEPTNQTRVEV